MQYRHTVCHFASLFQMTATAEAAAAAACVNGGSDRSLQ